MLPKPADDGGGKADDAEVKPDAEIDLVVIKAIHHAGEGGKPGADGEGDQNDSGEVDAHGARGLFVLCDGADRQPKLGAIEHILQPDDHHDAGHQHQHIVEAQVEFAEVDGTARQQRRKRLRIGTLRIK